MFKTCIYSTAVVAMAAGIYVPKPAAPNPIDPIELAEEFIWLGAKSSPEEVNCSRYSKLFAPEGVLHSPGIPDAYGRASIEGACEGSHGQVNPLISFQELNIQIHNWQYQPRTAFRWTINGVRTKDQDLVSAPAITAMWQDTNGSILDAYSFYDTNLIEGDGEPTPVPEAAREIAEQFVRFGSINPVPVGVHCTAFADMFAENGTWHLPGVPDYNDRDRITAACNNMVQSWHVVVPSIQVMIPVSTWNDYHKIAMRHTVAGESLDKKGIIIPSISVLFMDRDYKIVDAWAFYEQDMWPQKNNTAL